MSGVARSYQDAPSRWAGVGPYYAMFPVAFADKVVQTYTRPSEVVLDPFAGRGTAIFSAATQNRTAIGIEINPVGYVYGKAKLITASREEVKLRLQHLGALSAQFADEAMELPKFFHRCFSPRVRRFLLAARADLNWRRNKVDQTTMALLLVYLHGKRGAALSNQMRQTKAMSPPYAVRWWQERELNPPDIDPVAFMNDRLGWRYAKGTPNASDGRMYLGDSVKKLGRLRRRIQKGTLRKANLLFTSPPYHALTNYHYDQWLRLWVLGGPPTARRTGNASGGKFEGRRSYRCLLEQVFAKCVKVLEEDAIVYVRTDSREFTYKTTVSVLRRVFPEKQLTEVRKPLLNPSQTRLFGETNTPRRETGEVDLILKPR